MPNIEDKLIILERINLNSYNSKQRKKIKDFGLDPDKVFLDWTSLSSGGLSLEYLSDYFERLRKIFGDNVNFEFDCVGWAEDGDYDAYISFEREETDEERDKRVKVHKSRVAAGRKSAKKTRIKNQKKKKLEELDDDLRAGKIDGPTYFDKQQEIEVWAEEKLKDV